MATRQDIGFAAFIVETAFLGDTAAFALGDGTIRLVADGSERIAEAHAGAVLSACVADGTLVTGGDDGKVLATSPDGSLRTIAERPRKWIDAVTAGPNGAIAFATGRQAVVVDKDGERTFEHTRAVGGIAFAPKGYRLAAARYGGVSLWWAGRDAPATELEWKGAHIGVTFSPDGKTLVTAMQENALHGWRLADSRDMRMTGYPAKPRSMSWSWKGRYLASSGANAAILWPFHHKDGPMGRQPLQIGPRDDALVTRVACHPRREAVAIGYQDGAGLLTDFESSEMIDFRAPGGSPVSALAWDAEGKRLAFGCEDGAGGIVTLD